MTSEAARAHLCRIAWVYRLTLAYITVVVTVLLVLALRSL